MSPLRGVFYENLEKWDSFEKKIFLERKMDEFGVFFWSKTEVWDSLLKKCEITDCKQILRMHNSQCTIGLRTESLVTWNHWNHWNRWNRWNHLTHLTHLTQLTQLTQVWDSFVKQQDLRGVERGKRSCAWKHGITWWDKN